MIICKNCGVELEEYMLNCPLCGESVTGDGSNKFYRPLYNDQKESAYTGRMSQPQKKFTWEIISLILLSGVIATFVVDFIINKKITWSEYPAGISLTIFSFISLFAFWKQGTLIQMAGGFIISSLFLLLLDVLTGSISWSLQLGIPLLFAADLIIVALVVIFGQSKHKGINLIGWAFLGAALLCICIDGILSYYRTKSLHLEWSVIVAGSILPVVMVVFFAHFRLKKGRSLEKTFHI